MSFEIYIFEISTLKGLEILCACKRSFGEVIKSIFLLNFATFSSVMLVKEKIFPDTSNFFINLAAFFLSHSLILTCTH